MEVTKMAEYRSRETVAALELLLAKARAGEILGLAVCARLTSGPEKIILTDLYRRNPAKALSGTMRMSIRLTHLQDELDAASG